nr:glycosyltransferase family 2 protein [uncultured Methanospirillum sp.]
MRYSIIIPAYNEEKRIGKLLQSLSDPQAEFIFVCDGTDRTPEVIQEFSSMHPGLTVRCLKYSHRLGKGGGVYEGFRAANAPLIGFMDADNSTEYSEMIRLINQIGDNAGIIGSRHMPESTIEIHQPLSRRFQSRAFNLIIRLLFGLQFYDTQCGAKVFRKDAVDRVLPDLRAKGFEFDVELLWHLRRAGLQVLEVPVVWNDTGDSRLQTSDAFSMFSTLLRLRLGIGAHD